VNHFLGTQPDNFGVRV